MLSHVRRGWVFKKCAQILQNTFNCNVTKIESICDLKIAFLFSCHYIVNAINCRTLSQSNMLYILDPFTSPNNFQFLTSQTYNLILISIYFF